MLDLASGVNDEDIERHVCQAQSSRGILDNLYSARYIHRLNQDEALSPVSWKDLELVEGCHWRRNQVSGVYSVPESACLARRKKIAESYRAQTMMEPEEEDS